MENSIVKPLLIYILLIAAQILIFNHIFLFQSAIIFIFIYGILHLRINMNMAALISWAFFGGFFIDVFSDTLGINSSACLLMAVLRRPVFFLYVQKDDRSKVLIPTITNLGFVSYSKYVVTLTAIYCFIAFSLEYFSFLNFMQVVRLTICSTLLTFITILGLDAILGKQS